MSTPIRHPISVVIAGQVTYWRKVKDLNREEVAAAVRAAGGPESFTSAALRNIENTRRSVSVDEVAWLAAAFEVEISRLLGDHAPAFGALPLEPTDTGPVEDATRRALEELDELGGRDQALAATACVIAKELDAGSGTATSALAKQLSALLDLIFRERDDGDDDGDEDPA